MNTNSMSVQHTPGRYVVRTIPPRSHFEGWTYAVHDRWMGCDVSRPTAFRNVAEDWRDSIIERSEVTA